VNTNFIVYRTPCARGFTVDPLSPPLSLFPPLSLLPSFQSISRLNQIAVSLRRAKTPGSAAHIHTSFETRVNKGWRNRGIWCDGRSEGDSNRNKMHARVRIQ